MLIEQGNAGKALQHIDIVKIVTLKHAGKSSEEIAKQFHIETWVITMILELYD